MSKTIKKKLIDAVLNNCKFEFITKTLAKQQIDQSFIAADLNLKTKMCQVNKQIFDHLKTIAEASNNNEMGEFFEKYNSLKIEKKAIEEFQESLTQCQADINEEIDIEIEEK